MTSKGCRALVLLLIALAIMSCRDVDAQHARAVKVPMTMPQRMQKAVNKDTTRQAVGATLDMDPRLLVLEVDAKIAVSQLGFSTEAELAAANLYNSEKANVIIDDSVWKEWQSEPTVNQQLSTPESIELTVGTLANDSPNTLSSTMTESSNACFAPNGITPKECPAFLNGTLVLSVEAAHGRLSGGLVHDLTKSQTIDKPWLTFEATSASKLNLVLGDPPSDLWQEETYTLPAHPEPVCRWIPGYGKDCRLELVPAKDVQLPTFVNPYNYFDTTNGGVNSITMGQRSVDCGTRCIAAGLGGQGVSSYSLGVVFQPMDLIGVPTTFLPPGVTMFGWGRVWEDGTHICQLNGNGVNPQSADDGLWPNVYKALQAVDSDFPHGATNFEAPTMVCPTGGLASVPDFEFGVTSPYCPALMHTGCPGGAPSNPVLSASMCGTGNFRPEQAAPGNKFTVPAKNFLVDPVFNKQLGRDCFTNLLVKQPGNALVLGLPFFREYTGIQIQDKCQSQDQVGCTGFNYAAIYSYPRFFFFKKGYVDTTGALDLPYDVELDSSRLESDAETQSQSTTNQIRNLALILVGSLVGAAVLAVGVVLFRRRAAATARRHTPSSDLTVSGDEELAAAALS